MISLLFAIIFLILFIFLCIAGGNHLLTSVINNILSTENFENQSSNNLNKYSNNLIINPIDDCKKIDEISQNNLNFQTATNIPLSPYKYKNFIGSIYIDNNENNNVDNNVDSNMSNGKYCLKKNKLLYDGIWNPIIKKDSPYEYEKWNLTNGDVSDGYYCSDKLIEINKPFPENYIDKTAVYINKNGGKYYTYYNDENNDKYDTEIQCFPSVFNPNITEDLKPKFSPYYTCVKK